MNHPNQHIFEAIHKGKLVNWKSSTGVCGRIAQNTAPVIFRELVLASKEMSFEILPDLIKIGGIEVVAPLKEAKNGQQIFVLEPDGVVMPIVYRGSTGDNKFIDNRSAFVTAEAATAFNKAMKAYLK